MNTNLEFSTMTGCVLTSLENSDSLLVNRCINSKILYIYRTTISITIKNVCVL